MSSDNIAVSPEDLLAHAAWLQRLAARLVDPATADDLVQDTWMAALRSPPDGNRPLRPWLAQVLRNLVRNRARGERRSSARERLASVGDDQAMPSAEELLTFHEAQRLVAEIVSGLDEPYRSTVLLCYARGLAPGEVAARLGLPAGTVRWRLKRGLDEIRARLDARYGNDRRAWVVALGPVAAGAGRAIGASAPLVAGALGAPSGLTKLAVATGGLAIAGALALLAVSVRQTPVETTGVGLGPAAAIAAAQDRPAPVARPRVTAPTAAPPGSPSPDPGPAPTGQPAAVALAAAGPAAPAPATAPSEALKRAMEPGDAPSKGDPKAPVTLVMFTEFQCPFCARAQVTLKELLAAYPRDVRLVIKQLPLPFHENAVIAAEASLAAAAQGKYWEMHDRLYLNQHALDAKSLEEHAAAIGLDVAKFRKALEEGTYRKRVEEDARVAAAAGISGTPAFLVNGALVVGAQPLATFKAAIDRELARAKGLPVPELAPQARAAAPGPGVAVPAGPPDEFARRAAEVGAAPTRGDPKAPVTIVMFTEFQCPFCARVQPTLKELLAMYPKEVRLAVKQLPLPFHENALVAGEASLAAAEQGKYWEMHDRLYANQHALDPKSLEGHAAAIGLDLDRFRQALADGRYRKRVEEEAAQAKAAGLGGTPSFLINARKLVGAQPLARFKEAVDRELARARGESVPEPTTFVPGPAPTGRRDAQEQDWPPPRVALPDDQLGEKVNARFLIADAPTLGPAKAPVEILYFPEPERLGCGFDKVAVQGLRRTYGDTVRVVALPVLSRFSKGKSLVPEAMWAAHEQDRFWQLQDKLFTLVPPIERPAVEQAAKEVGLEMDAFRAVLDGGKYRERVTETADVLQQAGRRDCPAFIVAGRSVAGRYALVPLVEGALRKAGRKPPVIPNQPVLDVAGGGQGYMGHLLTPGQRFAVEPRAEATAAELEQTLSPVLAADLAAIDPTVSAVKLECKRDTCRVSWRGGKDGGKAVHGYATVLFATHGLQISGPGFFFSPRAGSDPARTPGDLSKRLLARRSSVLFNLRTGRVVPPPGLDVARLPRE